MKRKLELYSTAKSQQQQQTLLSEFMKIRATAVPHEFVGSSRDTLEDTLINETDRLYQQLQLEKAEVVRLQKIIKKANICGECGTDLAACDFCHEKNHIVCLTSCKIYKTEKYDVEECRACKKNRCDGCIAYCCKCDNPACKSCISVCKDCNKRICLVCVKYPCPKH